MISQNLIWSRIMSFGSPQLLLTCSLLAFSVFSTTALAQSGESVCSNALLKICQDTKPQRKIRNEYINSLKQDILAEASQKAAPRIEQMKKNIKIYRPIKRMVESFKIKNQEIMIAAKKRNGEFESAVINDDNIAKIKNYLNQAIDETKFDRSVKDNFKEIVSTVRVGNFADFIERTNLQDDVLAQLLSSPCGADGLVENAFATKINGERYVLICPGFLITLNQSPNAEERFNTILHAITHEIAHHIDNSKVGNAIYAPFLGCIASNYAQDFNMTKEDAKYCKEKAKTNEHLLCNVKVTVSHGGELVADQWGIAVSAIHARTQSYSVAETEQMLTDSWSKLCVDRVEGRIVDDEGIHPSGEFRIGTLMRKNPDIVNQLSCLSATADSRPACTFSGAIQ